MRPRAELVSSTRAGHRLQRRQRPPVAPASGSPKKNHRRGPPICCWPRVRSWRRSGRATAACWPMPRLPPRRRQRTSSSPIRSWTVRGSRPAAGCAIPQAAGPSRTITLPDAGPPPTLEPPGLAASRTSRAGWCSFVTSGPAALRPLPCASCRWTAVPSTSARKGPDRLRGADPQRTTRTAQQGPPLRLRHGRGPVPIIHLAAPTTYRNQRSDTIIPRIWIVRSRPGPPRGRAGWASTVRERQQPGFDDVIKALERTARPSRPESSGSEPGGLGLPKAAETPWREGVVPCRRCWRGSPRSRKESDEASSGAGPNRRFATHRTGRRRPHSRAPGWSGRYWG
jgi:hypothetical protein